MNRIVLTTCVLLIFGFAGWAQNLDKQKTTVKYTQLPLKPLPEDITQYWVDVDLGYIYSGDSKTETLNKIKTAAKLDHLEQTTDQGAKILVRLETYYKSEVNFETIERTEERDDKKVKVTYHYLTFNYKYPLYYELKLPNEVEPLVTEFINDSDEMTVYRSKEYRSSSDLRSWWYDNYKTIQSDLRKRLLNKNVEELNDILAMNFSYRKYNLYSEFYTVKKFKKFEYSDLDQAWDHAKSALVKIGEDDIVFNSDFNNEISKAIEIWKKALDKSDIENKKTRINKKVTEAIYNNMYLAYALMSDFTKAEEIKNIAETRINKRAIDNYAESFCTGRMKRFEINEGRIPQSL